MKDTLLCAIESIALCLLMPPSYALIVNSFFLARILGNFPKETPHPHDLQNVGPPTSSLGHLLPTGEGRVFPTLSRGEHRR